MYLDDGLDEERSEASSSAFSSVISSNLAPAGFVANVDKSVWDPFLVIVSALLGMVLRKSYFGYECLHRFPQNAHGF